MNKIKTFLKKLLKSLLKVDGYGILGVLDTTAFSC